MTFRYDNRVAIVTGAGNGLGRSHALGLAARGAKVVVNDLGSQLSVAESVVEEIRAAGGEAIANGANVTQPGEVEAMVQAAKDKWGRVDILVNNAVTSTSAPFDQLTDDEFRYHVDVKLMAYIRIARLVLPYLQAQGGGRMVNIGGMTARIVAPLRMTNGVTNAGVANFTKQFSSYAAQHHVTVNCIHPGYTATERVTQIFEREAKETELSVEDIIAKRTGDIPLGRLIEPEDIARAALFFCSPLAQMITGQCIAVDGGSGEAVIY